MSSRPTPTGPQSEELFGFRGGARFRTPLLADPVYNIDLQTARESIFDPFPLLTHFLSFSTSSPTSPASEITTMFANVHLKFCAAALFVAVACASPNDKRQDIGSAIDSLTSVAGSGISEVTSVVGSGISVATSVVGSAGNQATSAAGSVFTEATSGGGQILTHVTSFGGKAFTEVSSVGGQVITLATSGAGVVTSFGGSVYTVATGNVVSAASSVASAASSAGSAASSAVTSASAGHMAMPSHIGIPLLTSVAAIAGGIFFGAWTTL
ncbi:hypothetical protein EW146_g8346 [Bondarzewia mesenterica]|uniref:Uncharacterized protein n=1 Tax=Bondarzewia mesenterica TaxID=1095465 RepID=A0A4S4LFE1_9AGAM|nr:hypothetical protein EW146_g8346 [Bondarzewia mesenterica]